MQSKNAMRNNFYLEFLRCKKKETKRIARRGLFFYNFVNVRDLW